METTMKTKTKVTLGAALAALGLGTIGYLLLSRSINKALEDFGFDIDWDNVPF